MANERTPLRQNENVPPYVFITNHNRAYKNKIRKFQCCICAAFLAIFITALVITVSYTVNREIEEEDNLTTSTTPVIPTPVPQVDPVLNTLLTLSWPLQDKPYDVWEEQLNDTEINLAIDEGKKLLDQKELFEEKVPALQMNSPSYRHQMSTKTLPEARILSRSGYIMEGATKHLAKNRKNKKTIGKGPKIHVDWLPGEVCNETAPNPCSASSYRSADGSCNNLQHPRTWGVAMRPFRRHLPPEYGDGISAPRKAKDGGHLPSARDVSLTVHRPFYRDDPNFTVMLAVWGQFIDHDITATALSQGKGGSSISCCNGYFQSGLVTHPECYTVTLDSPDPYFEQYNVTCMEFVRSSPAPMCTFGPREQMNQASSFLDGSVVYGTSKKVMDQLRTFEGGELKMLLTPDGQELLPVSTDSTDGCNQEEQLKQGRYCFASGDPRSNENIHLTSIHLLFARQHNKIARNLAAINPGWDDEKLFQESRKIVAAQMQHITYNEFLPVILGPRLMSKLKMAPQYNSHSSNYDSDLDPSIANSFAASAFRFGHTLLPGLVRMIAGDNSSEEYVEMHKMLFNPFQLYDKGFLEKSVRGAINTSVEKVDTYFNTEFTQHLFERKPSIGRPKGMCGLDLVSLNVQRGRDHGLPGYPAFREHCGLKRPKTFEDLKLYMDEGSWDRIKTIYKDVDDIDMYSGALAELPLEGSLVGPTVTCILTDQFLRLKRGDRFWYETAEQPQAFTKDQLNAIKQTSLAKIICDTSDVNQVQPLVMRGLLNGNNRKACSELPEVDFTSWKENPRVAVDTPGKVWLIKGTMPKTPRLIKIGGSVSSGSLSINGNSIWSGSFPLNLPMKPFDAIVYDSELPEVSYPPMFSHGILWNGSISISGGKASVNGQLSVPQYVSSPSNQKNIVWYNGDFSLNIDIAYNSYEGVPTSISGLYTTPLYVHSNTKLANDTNLGETTSVTAVPSATPSQLMNDNVAPLTLIGTYSLDGNTFIWAGNLTLVIPSNTSSPLETTNLKLAYTPKSYIKRVRIGGKITSGTITAQGYNVWNGELPLAIPVDPFDTVAGIENTDNDQPTIYGHGINWEGSLIKVDATTNSAEITAQFSLPRFIHSNGISPFAIQWYNGDASLHLDIGWWSSCEQILTYSGTYTTSVYFASRKYYDYLKNTEPGKSLKDLDVGYAGSPKLYKKGLNAPLLLLGSYSNDGKTFYWSGNITLVLPKVVQIIPPQSSNLMATAPQQRLRVPLRLVGGQVNVGGWNVWYNSLPLGIPLKTLNSVTSVNGDMELPAPQHSYGSSIVWNGSISIVDSYNIKLHGTFSFPQYQDKIKNVTWLHGNFDLQFQSNKTFDIKGTYKTSIYFAERSIYETLREISVNSVDNLDGLGVKETPQEFHKDVDNYINAPIILLGISSYDKTEFLWSGDCILELAQKEPPKSTNILLAASSKEKTSFKLTGTVTKLSISLDGTEIEKNGVPPLTLPPIFDNVISSGSAASEPPVYGQGILWEGGISNIIGSTDLLISGKFSLPSTSNAGIIKWYNGNFSFYISSSWKTFNTSISGSFSSIIFLNGKKPSVIVNKPEDTLINEDATFNVSSVSADVSESAPMILSGEYLADGKSFLWSGDITLLVGLDTSQAVSNPILSAENSRVRVAAFTNGGSITIDGKSVWVGNRVPLAIPLYNLGSVIKPYYGVIEKNNDDNNAILWKGFISSEAPNTIKIWGGYSLPISLHKTPTDITNWYNGDFAFELKLLTEPESKLNLNGSFKSVIYLNEMSSYSGLKPEWNITEPKDVTLTATPLNKETGGVQFVPIILEGTYSADKNWFIWSGNVSTFLTI